MTVRELQDKILKLKKETDTCILAHSYMSEEICETADFTGDSYALAVKAKGVTQKNVIMQLAIENILDTEYRVFASGINAPGRNFNATIGITF